MKKLTTDDFIRKSKIKYGGKYDYSKVNYINNDIKIVIVCPTHGDFEQKPGNHLNNKYGCTKCGINRERYNKIEDKIKYNKEIFNNILVNFLRECSEIHKDRYDYSMVEYKNTTHKIKIICKEHGEFLQRPSAHLSGQGCMKCRLYNRRTGLNTFLQRCKDIHGDKYDYSLTEYKNSLTKVKVICKKHRLFEISPDHHINRKQGCSICKESIGEKLISKYLDNNNVEYEREYIFNDCKNIKVLRYDFYIPKYNLCIEYNGIQHYQPIEHFGGVNTLINQKIKDDIKVEYCKSKNIQLLIIRYDEVIEDKLLSVIQ